IAHGHRTATRGFGNMTIRRIFMRLSSLLTALVLALAASPAWTAPNAKLWPLWDSSNESSGETVDHTAWGAFLAAYIVEDDSGINKVAYTRVTPGDRQALQGYLNQLAQTDPRGFSKAEQLAYWINLYNALTVDVVLDNPGKKSILRMGKGVIGIGPWDDYFVTIAGEKVTLNDIEHRILRPIFDDRRIHFAINCASLGCPNLVAEAYTAQSVERLLNSSEQAFINHDRGVTFDEKGRLRLSKIFDWYGDDFAPDESALLAYLAQHHQTQGDALARYEGKVRYGYDWSLNAVE
ncbi:MAG: DUF547 domain-containing protein, partial [Pseudomonadota bacterium]